MYLENEKAKAALPSTHVTLSSFTNNGQTFQMYKQTKKYPGDPIPPGWIPFDTQHRNKLQTVSKRPIVNMVDLSDGMENPAKVKEVREN